MSLPGPSMRLPAHPAAITILRMTRVYTLLAIWLTLAVPAAGVAAVSGAPDCTDHAPAQVHDGHGGHEDHDAASGHDGCDCPCTVLHCGSAPSSIADSGPLAVHAAPGVRWMSAADGAGVPTSPPDNPFRPPASI